MRWFGLIAIAVFLVACGGGDDDDAPAATGGSGTQASGTSASPAATAPTAADGQPATLVDLPTQQSSDNPDVHVSLAVGSSGEVESDNPDPFAAEEDMGTVKVTIVSIEDPATTDSTIFQPAAGNKFWAIEVTMEATGDKVVNTGEWTLLTSDGAEFGTVLLTGVGDDIIYGALQPGETQQGFVVFEIPEGAGIESVTMDPSIYVGGNLIFDN